MSPIQAVRTGLSRRVDLAHLTPREQLVAGRLPHRIGQLVVGLWLFGTALAMFVRSNLGLAPWDVLHYGIATRLPVTLGMVTIGVSLLVLLLWIPIRQLPGVGTILNAVLIGIAVDVTLMVLPPQADLSVRWALLFGGIVVNGIGGALYIGAQLGPGPRDGLMTGLSARTGLSIRMVRTVLELTALSCGWLLGGIVGVGTVIYALLIGPATQLFLPMLTVRVDVDRAAPRWSQDQGIRSGPADGRETQDTTVD